MIEQEMADDATNYLYLHDPGFNALVNAVRSALKYGMNTRDLALAFILAIELDDRRIEADMAAAAADEEDRP